MLEPAWRRVFLCYGCFAYLLKANRNLMAELNWRLMFHRAGGFTTGKESVDDVV